MRFARAIGLGAIGAFFGAAIGTGVGAIAGVVAFAGLSLYMRQSDPGMLPISLILCVAVSAPLGILSGAAEGIRLGWRGHAGVRDLLRGLWYRFVRSASSAAQ